MGDSIAQEIYDLEGKETLIDPQTGEFNEAFGSSQNLLPLIKPIV